MKNLLHEIGKQISMTANEPESETKISDEDKIKAETERTQRIRDAFIATAGDSFNYVTRNHFSSVKVGYDIRVGTRRFTCRIEVTDCGVWKD